MTSVWFQLTTGFPVTRVFSSNTLFYNNDYLFNLSLANWDYSNVWGTYAKYIVKYPLISALMGSYFRSLDILNELLLVNIRWKNILLKLQKRFTLITACFDF